MVAAAMGSSSSSSSEGKKFYLFLSTTFLVLLSLYVTAHLCTSYQFLHQSRRPRLGRSVSPPASSSPDASMEGCHDLHRFDGHREKCRYVSSEPRCRPKGYINYLRLFYCACGGHPVAGYAVLVLWLVLLFYLLGNTAADYFCPSLESLSKVLKLSPTIAGVTLLSLGNGASDVFSSIISFMGASSGDVGLNSILGGAFFVSNVVTGIISICVGPSEIAVDKTSFVRDACFFLLALSSLLVIITVGRINLWGAIAFTSLYFVYVFFVSTTHFCRKKYASAASSLFSDPHHLPVDAPTAATNSTTKRRRELAAPLLLSTVEMDDPTSPHLQKPTNSTGTAPAAAPTPTTCLTKLRSSALRALWLLELPLYLPRRLTIPDVTEERWSKFYAVSSVTLAPLLLAALWGSQRGGMSPRASLVLYLVSSLVGLASGAAAFLTTERSSPPKRLLFPWLGGGFLMSVVWTYIITEELMSLLVSLGAVLGISPSILGLTVLAWGNSLGDLIANVAMALNGGADGAQVAISGCLAGPIFNTLMGLGLSLFFSSWAEYPASTLIPRDPSLYQTIGFLMSGLLWALVILPGRGMRLDKVLGIGLLSVYLCFLSLRVAQYLGLMQLDGLMGSLVSHLSR
uniref:Cation/calcium exchanger 1 n=1 Tax=Anthurium amnicola TaxID=1678845 RepID=A0A1D1Z425_9ARAE